MFPKICWRASAHSEAPARHHASAACYHLPKDIGIIMKVMAKLKLGQIKHEIFCTHAMVSPNDAALEQRPQTESKFEYVPDPASTRPLL
jgi:hypothetical protein